MSDLQVVICKLCKMIQLIDWIELIQFDSDDDSSKSSGSQQQRKSTGKIPRCTRREILEYFFLVTIFQVQNAYTWQDA